MWLGYARVPDPDASILDFQQQALWVNVGLFLAGAVVVWLAGTRLTRLADALANRTGLGHALVGALLLGGITSLPELATTSTAALGGNAPLAVNNILGGVAMQVAILAVVDAFVGKEGLSTLAGTSALLLQGNGVIVMLALAAAGITSGSIVVLGVDLWTAALLGVAVFVLASIHRYEKDPQWHPADDPPGAPTAGTDPGEGYDEGEGQPSNARLATGLTLAGLVVVAAGYLVTVTGDAISVQTGLGAGFIGATLVALATSLPEVSTTFEAVRLGRHRLAFSNIFGTNIIDVAFLFVADVLYRDGSALHEVGSFSLFAALLGIVLTGVYVGGILQRHKPAVLRMGVDSAVVLVAYVAGLVVLYTLR